MPETYSMNNTASLHAMIEGGISPNPIYIVPTCGRSIQTSHSYQSWEDQDKPNTRSRRGNAAQKVGIKGWEHVLCGGFLGIGG